MNHLSQLDQLHLEAADKWFNLGELASANTELEAISAHGKKSVAVLEIRLKIIAAARQWENAEIVRKMLPAAVFKPVHHAHTLHQLGRTDEAQSSLIRLRNKFPKEWFIPYELAYLCCKRGDKKAGMHWLGGAATVAGMATIQASMACEKELEPLFNLHGTQIFFRDYEYPCDYQK